MMKRSLCIFLIWGLSISTLKAEGFPDQGGPLFERIDYYFAVKSNFSRAEFNGKYKDGYLRELGSDKVLIKKISQVLRETPHTIDTIPIRGKAIRFLGEVPTPETIEILGELMLIDCSDLAFKGLETTIEEMTPEQFLNFADTEMAYYAFRNDKKAAKALSEMGIESFPIKGIHQYNKFTFEEAKEWYRNNRHRLDEVVRENWGDEWLESITPKKEPKRAIETEPEGELLTTKKRPVRTPPQEAEESPQEQSSNWVLILIFTPLAALIGFLMYLRKT